MKNLTTFLYEYEKQLKIAVVERPDLYTWPVEEVPLVALRMASALEKGSYNKDSMAIKRTCKELGIKYTYTEINNYLKGE